MALVHTYAGRCLIAKRKGKHNQERKYIGYKPTQMLKPVVKTVAPKPTEVLEPKVKQSFFGRAKNFFRQKIG